MPDFPDELVEAAAKAAMEAEPGQNWECATAKEADVYLRDSLAVLVAVVPLIEQRVIDKLAGEAGEPPYEEWNPTRAVWLEAVACGVAAERARWEAKQRQPEAVCDRCGAWKGLRAVGESCNTNCGGRVVAAALAPERTTTPDSMTGVEPVTGEQA